MIRILVAVAIFLVIGVVAYFNRYVPDAEQLEFEKKFDREAVLVKTCGEDPSVASGAPLRVFRFQEKLWYREINRRWRQVDGKVENVCDLLDIDTAHRPAPSVLPVQPGPVSRFMDFFRNPEPTPTPPKEIPSAKPNG